jgi:hypothetical protein
VKIYVLYAQATYDDGFSIIGLYKEKADAENRMVVCQQNEKNNYVNYWIEEEELE